MTTVLLYALLTTAIYYLGARAELTRAIWSRYPKWLDRILSCAACSGTWYGVVVSFIFRQDYLGLPGYQLRTALVVGLASCVLTPIGSFLMVESLIRLGNPASDEDSNAG